MTTEHDSGTDCRNTLDEPNDASRHLWQFAWVRDLIYFALALLALWLCLWLRPIVQPVFMGLLFAYLINPIVVWCQRARGWSRPVAVAVIFASAAVLLIALGLAVVPVAIGQASDLVTKIPAYLDSLSRQLGVSDEAVLERIKTKGAELMQDPISNLSYLWDGVVTGFGVVSGFIGTATSLALGLALFPVYLVYFSLKLPAMADGVKPFLPNSHRSQIESVAAKMDAAVGSYFRTRLIIGLIMGVMYAAGWGLVGVPYWLIVGMLAGLIGIIPYAATFAWLVAMLLRFLELENGISGTSDVVAVFVWPTLIFAIVQASDDWFWTPWLQGQQLDLSFVVIILSVLVGGAVAGLLGMLLAVPAAACVRIYWESIARPRMLRFAREH